MLAWRFLPLYFFATLFTVVLIFSGADWQYLLFVNKNIPQIFLVTTNLLGFVIPALALVFLLIATWLTKEKIYHVYTEVLIYSVLLGYTLSTLIKALTGRAAPPHVHQGVMQPLVDNSHTFNFGFLNGQILGGWPSSHATIFFAVAVAFSYILPARWYIRVVLSAIAFSITIGVSLGYHWLSEAIAGACLGTAVGMVVGTYFRETRTASSYRYKAITKC